LTVFAVCQGAFRTGVEASLVGCAHVKVSAVVAAGAEVGAVEAGGAE